MTLGACTRNFLNCGAQVKNTAKTHRDAGDHGTGAEFLSGFHKANQLSPIITITGYLGVMPWEMCQVFY